MYIVHAPDKDAFPRKLPRLFLGGTIDMGKSPDWQAKLERTLKDKRGVILNPRRPQWDDSWKNDGRKIHRQLRQQINWELGQMERADKIAVWFAPKSKSPITLLEIGLHMRNGKLLIGCPPEYSRAANVYVTAQKYGVKVFINWNTFADKLASFFEAEGISS